MLLLKTRIPNRISCRIFVNKNGCWIWTGAKTGSDGYAIYPLEIVNNKWKWRLVHRFLYEKLNGKIPIELHLDHLCRIRRCINPDHLEPVTQIENIRRGNQTKLSPEIVTEIKRMYSTGIYTQKVLAKKFNAGRSCIAMVLCGGNWKDSATVSMTSVIDRDLQLMKSIFMDRLSGLTLRSIGRKHKLGFGTIANRLERLNIKHKDLALR